MPLQTIIISTQNFPPAAGGIQSYIYELASALHNLGNNVICLCDTPYHSSQAEFDAKLPFKIERISGPKLIRRLNKARRLRELLAPRKNTTLICDSWKSLELLSSSDLDEVIITCLAHGMEFPRSPSKKKHRRISNTLEKAHLIAANSKFTAERVHRYSKSGNIQILHPGISKPPEPNEHERRNVKNWLEGHNPIITTIGRLEARKGHDKVIQAVALIRQQFPNIGYIIASTGEEQEALERLCKSLNVTENVAFCGHISDGERTALLRRADLFVMPCRAEGDSVEGFGIVYIEAAAQGTPSLAGRTGGAKEAVLEGKTGELCTGEDAHDVAQVLLNMLSAPQRLETLGLNAKKRALQEFNWNHIALNLLTLCELGKEPKNTEA